MPFKQLDFDRMRHLLGHDFGPLNIFCCLWTTLRFASIRPLEIDWQQFFLHRNFENDYIFFILNSVHLIANYHARVKAKGSIKAYAMDMGLPVQDSYCIPVLHAQFKNVTCGWVNTTLRKLKIQRSNLGYLPQDPRQCGCKTPATLETKNNEHSALC